MFPALNMAAMTSSRLFTAIKSLNGSNSLFARFSHAYPNFQQNLNFQTDANNSSHKVPDQRNNPIPIPPKKPTTPYLQYVKERFPGIKKENASTKSVELMKMVAIEWKNLNPDAKKKYQEQYHKDVEKFKIEKDHWVQGLSEMQLNELKEAKRVEKEEKLKKLEKRKIRERHSSLLKLGKPKKPPNSYTLFVQEKFKNENVPLKSQSANVRWNLLTWFRPQQAIHEPSQKEKLVKAAAEWKTLPKHQKDVYTRQSEELKEKYQADMREWLERMEEEFKTSTDKKTAAKKDVIKPRTKHTEKTH